MVDHRARTRTPCRSGGRFEALGGAIAAELESVAAFDQADALGGELLQFDRADLGAVLLQLRPALGLLVGVEFQLDAVDLAMEDVGERPQQVIEIVLEPGVRQDGGEVINDGGESGTDGFGFGQRARIGFVPAGPVAIEGQFVEQMRGG